MIDDLDFLDIDTDVVSKTIVPVKGRRGRPTREEAAAKIAARAAGEADGKIELPDKGMFYRPVGVKFLADVFRKEQRAIHKALRKCPVMEWGTHQNRPVPLWDFVTAASYLVPPKVDLMDYLSSLNGNNIPPHLNKMFWDAKLAKQRWEERARHTWKDEDVLAVLGDVAMTMKDAMQLWIENLPGKDMMTAEQYEALTASVSDLQDEITKKLIKMPRKRRTQSTITELDGEIEQNELDAIGDYDDGDDLEDMLA